MQQNQLFTKAEYLQALKSAMQEIDPDASVVEGDVLSCVFSAVAEVLSASSLNQIDPSVFFDIDSKNGRGLDEFAAFLGMRRLSGTYAQATLQFYCSSVSQTDLQIPVGCQVTDGAGHSFSTTSEAILKAGQMSVEAPAVAADVGTAYNVGPYTLTSFSTSLSSSLFVQNPSAAAGGTNEETDAAFRARVKADLFYKQIGTAASFEEALKLIDDNSRAIAVGSQMWHTQYAPLETLPGNYGGGLGFVSDVRDAKYVYPDSSFLIKNADQADQADYQQGVQYQFDLSSNPLVPGFQITATGSLDLSSYSGSSLNAIGSQIGLPRYGGSAGTGIIAFSLLSSVNTTVLIPAYTRFLDSEGNAYQTVKNAYIQPLQPSSLPVPFTSIEVGGIGSLSPGMSVNLNVGTVAPGNLYGTVSAYKEGTEAWTDGEYINQLEAYLASESGLAQGDMVYTAFLYNPSCSRCDIPNGITDKVDLFIDGQEGRTVTEAGLISLVQLGEGENQNWIYAEGNYVPQGSFIQILGTPAVDSLSSGQVQVGGASYQARLAKSLGGNRGSVRAMSALVFDSGSVPSAGESYVAELIQNKALLDSQYEAEKQAPLSLDVLVHEGLQAQISVSLLIAPLPGSTSSQIQSDLARILSSYFASLPFGRFVNAADILSQCLSCPYVRTCRFSQTNPIQVAIPYSTDAQIANYDGSFWLPTDAYPALAQVTFNFDSSSSSLTLPTGNMPNIFVA